MTHLSFIAFGLLIGTAVVAGFFAYLYSLKRQTYQIIWTAAWALFSVYFLSRVPLPAANGLSIHVALGEWIFALAALFFFLGAQLYSQREPWLLAAGSIAAAVLVWALLYWKTWLGVPPGVGTALILFATSLVFFQESRRQETLAERLLAVTFGGWAILQFSLIVARDSESLQQVGLWAMSAVPAAFVAILMVMALYEEEKRRVERNMLALSNLNLATSSFVGGEIQRMLAQALDRVLGVVRIPAGALFLHHGDPQGPTS
ncbi:MAG TPA: hypothetical protein VEH49_04600, partial [Methylomirabilota bacterium]|nr:hypothetical protein [Methylomirabilota bacterium]